MGSCKANGDFSHTWRMWSLSLILLSTPYFFNASGNCTPGTGRANSHFRMTTQVVLSPCGYLSKLWLHLLRLYLQLTTFRLLVQLAPINAHVTQCHILSMTKFTWAMAANWKTSTHNFFVSFNTIIMWKRQCMMTIMAVQSDFSYIFPERLRARVNHTQMRSIVLIVCTVLC